MTGAVAAIGDPVRVRGWALAGVRVIPAGTTEEARHAWRNLPADVSLVIADGSIAACLQDLLTPDGPLLAVLPP